MSFVCFLPVSISEPPVLSHCTCTAAPEPRGEEHKTAGRTATNLEKVYEEVWRNRSGLKEEHDE